jgi:hypothetical protein
MHFLLTRNRENFGMKQHNETSVKVPPSPKPEIANVFICITGINSEAFDLLFCCSKAQSKPVLLKLGAAAPQGAMKLKSGSPDLLCYFKNIFFTLLIHSKQLN